jgi:hypothetical protein
MIYILTACHNADYLDSFLECVESQTNRAEILPVIVDASEDGVCEGVWVKSLPAVILSAPNAFWGESLTVLQDYMKKNWEEGDIVCILNIDRAFCRDYIRLGSKYVHDKFLIISHGIDEGGKHVSGGLQAIWKHFHFTFSLFPNICGTNGLFMYAKDFAEVGELSRWLPHHWQDFYLVHSLVKRGYHIYEPDNLKLTIYTTSTGIHNPKSWKELFDKRCSCNPIYMAIFIVLCCPLKYIPINLLRCLWWTVKVWF